MSWKVGGSRKQHTDACRERFAKLLEGQAKFENSRQRLKEFTAKQLQRKQGQKRIRDGGEPEEADTRRRVDTGGGIGAWPEEEDMERVDHSREVPGGSGEAEQSAGGNGSEEPVEVEGEEVSDQDRSVNKRKGDEEAMDEERAKRAKNREGRQGMKRKKEEDREEQEEIRRLIEDAVSQSNKARHLGRVEIGQVVNLVGTWVKEVEDQGFEEVSVKGGWEAYDDVKGGRLPYRLVKEARREEVRYMVKRGMWVLRPIQECWERLGKGPTSVKWVDTDKGPGEEMQIRSRLVARDFKGSDKDRDDLFAGTPPLEAKRLSLSRAATRTRDGRLRKLMFIDVRKAHCNPLCEVD